MSDVKRLQSKVFHNVIDEKFCDEQLCDGLLSTGRFDLFETLMGKENG